jgi:hypothetical protein
MNNESVLSYIHVHCLHCLIIIDGCLFLFSLLALEWEQFAQAGNSLIPPGSSLGPVGATRGRGNHWEKTVVRIFLNLCYMVAIICANEIEIVEELGYSRCNILMRSNS